MAAGLAQIVTGGCRGEKAYLQYEAATQRAIARKPVAEELKARFTPTPSHHQV